MSVKKQSKLVTVYEVRKALYLHFPNRPITDFTEYINGGNEDNTPAFTERGYAYFTNLDITASLLGLKTIGELRPYADGIYLEDYNDTLYSSCWQFHNENVQTIRRFLKEYPSELTFSTTDLTETPFALYLSRVLMLSMTEYVLYQAKFPSKELLSLTNCSCEMVLDYMSYFAEYPNVSLEDVIAFFDNNYLISFNPTNKIN